MIESRRTRSKVVRKRRAPHRSTSSSKVHSVTSSPLRFVATAKSVEHSMFRPQICTRQPGPQARLTGILCLIDIILTTSPHPILESCLSASSSIGRSGKLFAKLFVGLALRALRFWVCFMWYPASFEVAAVPSTVTFIRPLRSIVL